MNVIIVLLIFQKGLKSRESTSYVLQFIKVLQKKCNWLRFLLIVCIIVIKNNAK